MLKFCVCITFLLKHNINQWPLLVLCALIMGNGCFYLWRCFLMIVQIHKESSVIGNNVLWVGRVSRFACGQMDTGLVSLLPDRRLWGSCTVAETWGEVIITNNNPAGAPMYCNAFQCAPMCPNKQPRDHPLSRVTAQWQLYDHCTIISAGNGA